MKQVRGIWLPDDEIYFLKFLADDQPEFAGAGTYQLRKIMACMPYVKNFHHAVDVGAHVGLWSRVLARMFTKLTAFEPVRRHIDCLLMNVPFNVDVWPMLLALGDHYTSAILHSVAGASGNTRVATDGVRVAKPYETIEFVAPEEVAMKRLDDVLLVDNDVIDFLKIDVEGYEYFVLKGGEKTIRRTKPVICVEQKPAKGAQYGIGDLDACKLLDSWGAKRTQVIGGDYIYTWE